MTEEQSGPDSCNITKRQDSMGQKKRTQILTPGMDTDMDKQKISL
jgi:hypothetical protein